MAELLTSDLSLAAMDLVAAKKTPVNGLVMVLFLGFALIILLLLVFIGMKRRR